MMTHDGYIGSAQMKSVSECTPFIALLYALQNYLAVRVLLQTAVNVPDSGTASCMDFLFYSRFFSTFQLGQNAWPGNVIAWSGETTQDTDTVTWAQYGA